MAAHLRPDPATGMVSGPALPERTAMMSCGAEGMVSGSRSLSVDDGGRQYIALDNQQDRVVLCINEALGAE